MFCPQCGTSNTEDSRFCSKCGLDLNAYKAGMAPGQPSGGGYQTPPPPSYQQPQYQQGYQQPPYQGYQQPPYQQPQPPYGGGYGGVVPRVASHLGWAIAVLILCFLPTGIVAVVHASHVNNRLAIGDVNGAMESSHKAKVWCWVTFAIGIFWIVLAIIGAIAGWFAMTGYYYYN
jgi:hypothetical protein